MSPTTPTVILLNPNAAGGRAAALAAPVAEWLKQHAPDSSLCVSQCPAQTHQVLREQPSGSRIVLVGGDGTVNQCLPELLAGQHTLALVPCGSGNDLARALGLFGMRWQDALQHVLHAPAHAIDVGWVGERAFASSLAIGFDAAVAERAHAGPQWLTGLPRYLWALAGEIANLQLANVQIALDGEPIHSGPALFTSVLNTKSYGSGMPAVPNASIHDGHLDLLIAGQFGRAGTLAMLPRLLTGSHIHHPRVQLARFRTMHLQSNRPMPHAADGEPLPPASDLQIRIQAGALRCVMGRDSALGG